MNWRRLMRITAVLAAAIVLVIAYHSAFMITALADAAPPPAPAGSDLSPDSEGTQVRMVSETVVLELAKNSDYYAGHALVTARFLMRNLGRTTESMVARFPMNHSDYDIHENNCRFSPFPAIDEIGIWVDDEPVEITKTIVTLVSPVVAGQILDVPCWAHFPVSFPPNQDVSITVKYKVSGYRWDPGAADIEYFYVLETGAGWKGTIAEANILMRFPYDINSMNFIECDPRCSQNRREIRWIFKDIEPTQNIRARLLLPSVWKEILKQSERTENHPNDGMAWGRLGRAYQQAIMSRRGFRFSPATVEMYQLSQQAYEKAIALRPDKADWRYGLADLLCWNAEWELAESTFEEYGYAFPPGDWKTCVAQLKQVLDIDPNHLQANLLARHLSELYVDREGSLLGRLVDLKGPQPDYPILTETSTFTPRPPTRTATSGPTVTETKSPWVFVRRTETPIVQSEPLETGLALQPVPTVITAYAAPDLPKIQASVTPSSPADTNDNPNSYILELVIILLLGVVVATRWFVKMND